MAKASKKPDGAEQSTSRNGQRRAPAAGRKAAHEPTEAGDNPTAAPGSSESPSVADAVSVDTLTVEVLSELTADAPTSAPSAGAAVLDDALADVRALSEALWAARAETADLLAVLRSETAAAVAEVIELRHQCRHTGEKLVLEIGEQSLALTRVRQAREQAEELARGTHEVRTDFRALGDECGRVAAALNALAEQSRSEFRASLDEALDGVRKLRDEIESARAQAAEPAEPPHAVTGAVPAAADVNGSGEHKNRFGVTVATAVVIAEVLADGPAATAGFVRGDVIEEANGRTVHTGTDVRDAVLAVPDGEDVTLQIRRGGERLVRTVRLGTGTAEGKNRFGVTVAPRVVVAEVFADSPAEASGLARGDVIEDAHGQPIQTGEQFHTIMHAQPEGAEVMLVVTRNGERHELLAHLDHV